MGKHKVIDINQEIPLVDGTENFLLRDVVGNKTDAATIPSNTTSIVAALKKVYNEIISITTETDKLIGGEYTGIVPAGTAVETVLKEIITSTRIEIKSIWLDLSLLVTAGATIKLYHKIDGTNYKIFETDSWALTDDDGVLVTGFTINNDFKITITGGEAADVNIPYNIIYQSME